MEFGKRFFQSCQLQSAVGSPDSAKKCKDQRTLGQQLAGAENGAAKGGRLPCRRGVTDLQGTVWNAGIAKIFGGATHYGQVLRGETVFRGGTAGVQLFSKRHKNPCPLASLRFSLPCYPQFLTTLPVSHLIDPLELFR